MCTRQTKQNEGAFGGRGWVLQCGTEQGAAMPEQQAPAGQLCITQWGCMGASCMYGRSTGSLASLTGQGVGRHALRSAAGAGCCRHPT